MFAKISAIATLGLLVICGTAYAQTPPTALMECQEKGGLTPKGQYFVRWSLNTQGIVKFEDNNGKRTLRLKKPHLQKLKAEIDAANFDALTATPSGKMSPAAYDGMETNYIFYAKGRRRTIPTYKYVFPPNTTLLKTVETLRKQYKF